MHKLVRSIVVGSLNVKYSYSCNYCHFSGMDGCMHCDFASFSTVHVSGRWMGDNERLCAMGPRLRLKLFSPQVVEPGTLHQQASA